MSAGSPEAQQFDFGAEPDAPEERPTEQVRSAPATISRRSLLSAADLRARLEEVRAATVATTTVLESAETEAAQLDEHGVEIRTEVRTEVQAVVFEDYQELETVGEIEPEAPESLTIAEFYERVRRALASEFTEDVWVTGEIRGLRDSKGHHYLELADHDAPVSGRRSAQALEVVCWAREWPSVARALAEAGLSLEVGQVVRVRGRVSVWEGGNRIRFTLTALDVEAMLGQIAQNRRRLLQALEAEGLLDANKKWPLSLVPLRIGLVTSPSSEAHRDFVSQLEGSGFAFVVRLEASFVQGPEAPGQLVAALRRLETFEPDLGIIVRGGGARGDLAAFDNEDVARAVANASFPIWTGIGHTGDRSVVDDVAHSAFITPTACAKAVIAVVHSYWDEIGTKTKMLTSLACARLDSAKQRLSEAERTIIRGTRHQLVAHASDLETARARILRSVGTRLRTEELALGRQSQHISAGLRRFIDQRIAGVEQANQVLRAYDPARQLARGWSLTHDEQGRVVRSAHVLKSGVGIRTRFVDGEVSSVVTEVATTKAGANEGHNKP